ncbi:hypothetical protein MM213_07405 [Belliella sp. R4-6]|uniref:Uncharacterized protein n=1 Tax=Belliella alkalica TaxID=1730871 RepID=A0ABS9VBQ2_9BACT|nr:hypothetical protein [Belliella alkalica]MCH7413303.1 hypothetical protein [Belliella alkalica]
MTAKKNSFEEVENILQDIGSKIEQLIEKAAEVSGDAKVEIEKKIKELKDKETTISQEFQKGREKAEKLYQEKKSEMEPNLKKSKRHFINAFKQLGEAFNTLFRKD